MARTPLSRQDAEVFSGIGTRNALFEGPLHAAMNGVLDSAELIDGPALTSFERDFASYVGSSFCVGVANGLDALRIGLQALEVGPGDEVLVPAQTFVASLIAVEQVGATPVPVDVDPRTGLIDIAAVPSNVTPQTRAAIAVHLHGRLVDIKELRNQLGDSDIAVIEDAAQAHGAIAEGSGERAGSLGDLAAFSFYPTKNLGALGDGGAVTTSRPEVADAVRRLSRYGDRSLENGKTGPVPANSRLDTLQAAFLTTFLPHLDNWNTRRKWIASRYDEVLLSHGMSIDGTAATGNVYHHYVILHHERDYVSRQLSTAGVPTLVHYPIPAYRHPALGTYRGPSFSGAEARAKQALSLPIHPWMSDDVIQMLCDRIDRSLS